MGRLSLQVRCETQWGESVAVVGSWNMWNSKQFTLLDTDASSYPIWRGAVDVKEGNAVEYKYGVVKDGMVARWESDGRGDNRKAVLGDRKNDDVFGQVGGEEMRHTGQAGDGEVSDLGNVDVALSDETSKLDKFEKALVEINKAVTSWRQRLSFVRSLFTDENSREKYGFETSSVDHLVSVCIYLTYLSSGQIPCEDNDGHHRPNHHALESRQLDASLKRLARDSDEKWIPYLIRRIYPCLPSYAPQYTASTPLTRIRDIAHRSDIPQDLKSEIKHDLQNKLHRCAGPEDLRTCERILAKVTSPGAQYSSAFVSELKTFYSELLEFFNATALDDRLQSVSNNDIPGLPKEVAILCCKLLKMKRGNDSTVAQLSCLTELRNILIPWVTSDSKSVDMADADLQQVNLLDITLEKRAFTLLAAAAATAENGPLNNESTQTAVQSLSYAMENLRLSSLDVEQAMGAASELRNASTYTMAGSRDSHLRLHAAIERSLRLCENLSEETVNLFGSRVGALSSALGVAPHAAKVFAEAQIRAHCFFQASRISSALMRYMRKLLSLPPWEVLRPGVAVGKTTLVTSVEKIEDTGSAVIAVVKQASGDEDIPRSVKGIILGHDLPSLSHLGVRARQAQIVFACSQDTSTFSIVSEALRKFNHAKLTVTDEGEVNVSNVSDESQLRENEVVCCGNRGVSPENKKVEKVDVYANLRIKKVLSLAEATPETSGQKCAYSGILARLANRDDLFRVPNGLALPFGVFAAACDVHGGRYKAEVEKYIASKTWTQKDRQSDRLRSLIERDFEVPENIIHSIQSGFSEGDRVMVRSSANCEDLEEMSGAGLYDSIANIDPSVDSELVAAIKTVWGSLWSRRAARSRAAYRVDHTGAFMGVLVQRMVKSELSFVAFSQNPISGNASEVYIELAVGMGETLASARARGNPLRATFPKNGSNAVVKTFPSFGMKLVPGGKQGLISRAIDYSTERVTVDREFRAEVLRRIGTIAIFLEKELGGAQDIEGTVVDGAVCIIQTRPMVT